MDRLLEHIIPFHGHRQTDVRPSISVDRRDREPLDGFPLPASSLDALDEHLHRSFALVREMVLDKPREEFHSQLFRDSHVALCHDGLV